MISRFTFAALTVAVSFALGATPASRPQVSYFVSRLDVANAYMLLDRAVVENPPANDQEKERVHREFDRALMLFFDRKQPEAVQLMNELTESISPKLSHTPEARLARSMRVRVAPWIALEKRPSPLRIKLSPMYAVPIDKPVKLRIVIRPDDDAPSKPVFDQEIQIDSSGLAPIVSAQQPDAPIGRYRIELVAPDGSAHVVGRWFIAPASMDQRRQANERRLVRIQHDSRQITCAQAAVSSRNALLSDQLSETEMSKALANPLTLAAELEHEITELEADRDPFVSRAGEYYRTFLIGAMTVPARVYVPKSVTESGKPVPLVFALHGAGGEEGQFMTAYGAGRLKQLADEKGFIVVAPSTYHMMTAPDPVKAIVEQLALDYLIDRSRVYAIGHSLGALTVESLANRCADQLAAVCLLAGAGAFPDNRQMPPTLLILAELDPIFRPEDMNKHIADAKRLGLPVESRILPHTGHALIVGDALPEAVDWMLEHQKP